MTEDAWFEERNGRLCCKKDGMPLQLVYKPRNHNGGYMKHPPMECPGCKRYPTDAELESYPHLRI
jgi:hypothetical protein